MLTRLKVSGFKNLVDVDVRFGPFTCVAGANGVGKSNLFDAIRFLSATADMRIPKILQLLQDIATDVDEPIGIDNPLRQVIINTHSPSVVMQVPDDSLLVAELKETVNLGKRFKRVSLACLPETWRQKDPEGVNDVPKNKLLAYLNPVVLGVSEPDGNGKVGNLQQSKPTQPQKLRVVDRTDLQPLIPGFPTELA
ncbi:MAG: AAA family ATPase [Nostoc sp.]|uniref:AAA family ATPase n=1 Tax=Nostoc sp. TaxID=1180 RepID=UPI002FFCC539